MHRSLLGLLLLTTACAHSAADEARFEASANKQEELGRAIERLSLQQETLAQDVRELKKAQEELSTKLTDLDNDVDVVKKARADARPRPSGPDADAIYLVPIGDGAVRGPAGAKITIVEYADFQCPFCARVYATIQQIEKEYPNEIRFVYKHLPLPFHQNALPAAKAAEAAGVQGKFWPMFDLLWQNSNDLSAEKLDELAQKLQLNMRKFKVAVDDPKTADKINDQSAEANRLGAHGTPFFINGRSVVGAQPFESFKKVIDEELKRADKLLATGVKRTELYGKLVAEGRTKE